MLVGMDDIEKLAQVYEDVVHSVLASGVKVRITEHETSVQMEKFSLKIYLKDRLFGYVFFCDANESLYMQNDTDNYLGDAAIEDARVISTEIMIILDLVTKGRVELVTTQRKSLFGKKLRNSFIFNADEGQVRVDVPATNNYSLSR